jgi:hypothetical protein
MNWLFQRVRRSSAFSKKGAHNSIDLLGAHVYTSS